MCVLTDGSERDVPSGVWQKTDNGISVVFRCEDGYVYKRSIPYLIQNEMQFYLAMNNTGFVPHCEVYDKYTLKIFDLGESEEVTDADKFIENCKKLLYAMIGADVRHGDLTRYAIIVKNNHPYVIDWAESRWYADPAPDKRHEGDRFWLENTIEELCGKRVVL